ncbi:hypothetical protein [Actinomycetospora soli]|uniref:hypothetical protein n=1 Tax=Actinomycetospora soli TaxID=2893887 RepID=UPI001E33BA4F|nr:hypothetical protein [Actinomycetospora soli]MCD2187341.1 hypothetical protein [Actinomycetospora soli]
MDTGTVRTVRTLLGTAALVCAALVGGLVSVVLEDPTDVRAWVGVVLAIVAAGLVGRADRLVRRNAAGPTDPAR